MGSETTIHIENFFPRAFKMDKLARCIYDPAIKRQYDQNMDVYEKEDLTGGGANLLIYTAYFRPKKMLVYQMDFFEKGFQCFYNNKYYHWTSAAYELNERGSRELSRLKQGPDGAIRGESFYSLTVMERETKDTKHMGKIKLTSLSSRDYRTSFPAIVRDPFVKKSMKSWIDELTKFYQKNHKNI